MIGIRRGAVPSHSLLGVRVDAFELDSLNAHVEELIRSGRRAVIGHHNLHSIYLCGRNPRMRAFYDRAEATFIDGMGVIFAARALGLPLGPEHRITYVDWIGPLMALAERRGWRVFYLGSAQRVVDAGAKALRARYPDLELEVRNGYFDDHGAAGGEEAAIDAINAYRPHILLVGMGMPRQEEWILRSLDRLDARVVLSSGGCMDYLAGAVPTPPRAMARLGFEWLFRVLAEPRRLARRVLWEPWFLLPAFARELVARRRPRLRVRRDDTSLDDLERVSAILEEGGVRYWLDSGTLLGVVRDGHLPASDPDIDLAIWAEDEPALEPLLDRFRALGYRVRSEAYQGETFNYTLIPPLRSKRKRVDVYVYRRHDGHAWAPAIQPASRAARTHPLNPIRAWRFAVYLLWVLATPRLEVHRRPWKGFFRVKTWWLPAAWFEDTRPHGTGLPLPVGWKEYLALRYGDWTTPVANWSFWTDDGALRPVRPEAALTTRLQSETTWTNRS